MRNTEGSSEAEQQEQTYLQEVTEDTAGTVERRDHKRYPDPVRRNKTSRFLTLSKKCRATQDCPRKSQTGVRQGPGGLTIQSETRPLRQTNSKSTRGTGND